MNSSSTFRGDLRSPRLLALAASSLLLSSAFAQQPIPSATRPALDLERARATSDAASLPGELQDAMLSSLGDQLLYDEAADGALWVRGATYKARFGLEGPSIVPFFGSEAPRNFPLGLRARSASLGGQPFEVFEAACAAREGDTVRFDRGAFVEEYDLTTSSLEQRFVFDELPADAAGDLVVRMDVASELAGSDQGLTLSFVNDHGRVDYGAAFALDAAGRHIELDSTLADGAIELRVPASFVATAELPLVIDPLITMHTAGSTSFHDIYPDVSYDVTTDRWCIVFAALWSQVDHDVYARFATGDYTLIPGLLPIDFTSDTWTTPKIANNNHSNQFLVCAAVVPSSGIADIRGRFVQPAGGTAGPVLQLSPLDGAYRNWPDVGGDSYPGQSSNFCVVWQRSVSASNVDIEARTISHDGTMSGLIKIEDTNEWHELPTISNAMGLETSTSEARWTIAWQQPFTPSDRDVWAAQLGWNGAIVEPRFPVTNSGLDETNPVASTLLDPELAGGPRTYVIAFERNFGDHDVIASVLQGSTVLHESNLIGDYPSDRWYDAQRAPAVDSDGSQFLIGFDEIDLPAQQEFDVYVRSYFWDGARLVPSENPQVIGGSPAPEADVAVHSMASSGGPVRDYLATFAYGSANHGFDVIGALYWGATNLVEATCFGDGVGTHCPCGNDGEYGHGCGNTAHSSGGLLTLSGDASVSQDTATFTASELPSNVACLFFQGTALTPRFVFGSGLRCVSGATVRLGLEPCDASGLAAYPQLGDPSISVRGQVSSAGTTRYYQAWYRNPGSVGCGTFNLTNALRVTWLP